MSNENSYYEQSKEKLKECAQNCYYSKKTKTKSKGHYKNQKKRLQEQA